MLQAIAHGSVNEVSHAGQRREEPKSSLAQLMQKMSFMQGYHAYIWAMAFNRVNEDSKWGVREHVVTTAWSVRFCLQVSLLHFRSLSMVSGLLLAIGSRSARASERRSRIVGTNRCKQ
jgi:hypothetical protein